MDVSEKIDTNKTDASMECNSYFYFIFNFIGLSFNHMYATKCMPPLVFVMKIKCPMYPVSLIQVCF